MLPDYYKILQVDKSAEIEVIERAYKILIAKYHPDRNPGDKTAESRSKAINEAHDVLRDPIRRKNYDDERASCASNSSNRPPVAQPPVRATTAPTTPTPPLAAKVLLPRTGKPPAGLLWIGAVLAFILLFKLGSTWISNRRGVSDTLKMQAVPRNRTVSQPTASTTTVHPPQLERVRVRRISAVIYSYSASRWGGNSSGFPGDSLQDVNLEFWSGLVSGYANIHWKGSYSLERNNLCLTISGLQIPTRSILGNFYQDFGVGYGVELENGTFGDFTMSRALILYRTFLGDSPAQQITKCFQVLPIGLATSEAYHMAGQWEGSGGYVNLTMRLSQKGNSFEGSMIVSPPTGGGQPETSKVSIEGYVLDGRITFVRHDKNALVDISYVAPVSRGNLEVSGTWFMGVDRGQWQMTRTGDVQGEADEFASPDSSNPPASKEALPTSKR